MKELLQILATYWPSLALLCLSAIPAAYMHSHDHGKLKGWGKEDGFFGKKQWLRKWKRDASGVVMTDKKGNPIPAFLFSDTILSWLTDGYHSSQALMRILMSLSITLAISAPWWSFLLIWGAYSFVHWAFYKLLSR